MANKQMKIPTVNISKGSFSDIKVGKIQFGTTMINEILLNNVNATANVGPVTVKDVEMSLDLHCSIEVCVDIDLWLWDYENCFSLTSFTIPFPTVPLGDIKVTLSQLNMLIDSVRVNPMSVNVNPVQSVNAPSLKVATMQMNDLKIPKNPFSLGGMDVDAATLSAMNVPAVYARLLKVNRTDTLQVTIPEITLPQIALDAKTGMITSTQNLQTRAEVSRKSYPIGGGWVYIKLTVQPVVNITIDKLEINGVTIHTTVNSTKITNITVPMNILDIAMGDLNIEDINVPVLNL